QRTARNMKAARKQGATMEKRSAKGRARKGRPQRPHAKAKPVAPRTRGRPVKAGNGEVMRERIMDAAEELFAEHGFDGVTVRQVTRKADVDVALAHYYFGTKKGLFDAV